MSRRKLCSLSVAFLLGTAAAEYHRILLWCILIFYGMVWTYSVKTAYKKAAAVLFGAVVFAAAAFGGIYNSYYQRSFRNTYESVLEDGEKCLIQGEIYQKEISDKTNLYYLKNCIMQYHQKNYFCNQILASLNEGEYAIGEILCIQGNIHTFALPANEGGYNEREYYQSLGIGFKVAGKRIVGVSGKKSVFREGLYQIRENMKESYRKSMSESDAGVLMAMVLGDKSFMDPERKKLYQNAGISHFYSISGLHISMIGMALYCFIRKRGAGCFISGGVVSVVIYWYGMMTGFGISVRRAAGMFFLLLYAKSRGRSYDRITALTLTAAVLALENPMLLRNSGYLLSFGAVLGVLLAEWIIEHQEIKSKGKEAFLVSFCVQLTTIPVMCCFFYEISVYAVFINLLVVPCMGILLGSGMIGGAAGCFLPFMGKILLFPCSLILLMFDTMCRNFLKLPCALLITGKMSFFCIFCWYILISFVLLAGRQKEKLPLLPLCLPFVCLVFMAETPALELDILDIGQGDAIYLSAGDGTSVFIDGGSSSMKKAGTYTILPFLKSRGVRKIDYWFVSHCDADHINGLCEVLEADYKVQNLVVSRYMPKDEAWESLKNTAKAKKVSILVMDKGDAVKSSRGGWSIKCLSTGKGCDAADRNANSLALLFESSKLCGFFAGDIGAKQEKELLRAWNLPKVDVYKASHHGSDYSNCSELLKIISPKITVISCSMKNSYGHPGREAVSRICETGSRIYETRYLGQIKITGEHLEAEGFLVLK